MLWYDFRSRGGRQLRPRGLAWRRESSETLHRLADFLRLRRRLQCRCTPEQKDRHNSFDATLPSSAGHDIQWDAAGLADATQFIKVSDLAAPLRSTHRARNGHSTTQQRGAG